MSLNQICKPLKLAVALNARKCAHVLVNYQANATKPEPGSGMSALTIAFSKANEAMATLLLQYGASPDAKDAKGNTARSLATKDNMKALIEGWDKHGAMAFEVCVSSTASPLSSRTGNAMRPQLQHVASGPALPSAVPTHDLLHTFNVQKNTMVLSFRMLLAHGLAIYMIQTQCLSITTRRRETHTIPHRLLVHGPVPMWMAIQYMLTASPMRRSGLDLVRCAGSSCMPRVKGARTPWPDRLTKHTKLRC